MTLHHKHLPPLCQPQHLASVLMVFSSTRQRQSSMVFFFSVAGAAQDNYFDEESEDNESDEEGDIDEDMVDIDRCEICIFLCVVRNLLHRKIKFC